MTTVYVSPGETPQSAADRLASGDALVFKPGVHYGRVEIKTDNIEIQGEEGAILDGTEPVSGQWEEANDNDGFASLAGTGTWRAQVPGWAWMLLDEQANVIFRIDNDYVGVKEPNNFYMSAFEAMAVPNGAAPSIDYGYPWWDGIEALSTYSDGYVFCRYRDGKRPGKMRWSGGYTDHRQPPYAEGSVIYLGGRSGVNVKGLTVRGCVVDIAVVNSRNILIDKCTLRSFDFGVRVQGDCDNVKILHSDFNCKLYGTTIHEPCSKIDGTVPYPKKREVAWRQYTFGKFFHDESDSTHLSGLSIYNGWVESSQTTTRPKNIEFAYNHVTCGQFGVDMFGGDGIDIHHNRVHNMIDIPFQRQDQGGHNVKIHDNETYEAGYEFMRWHRPEQEAGDNFVYNNRSSDLDKVGDFFAFTGYKNPPPPSPLRLWIYHNSYSGGNSTGQIAGVTSMDQVNWINNIMPLGQPWPHGVSASNHNAPIWPTDQIEHEFKVPDGHECKGNAIDVSKPFTVGGRQYGPLPGFESGYAKDIGWNARGDEEPPPDGGGSGGSGGGGGGGPTLSANPATAAPGATVTAAWTGSTSPKDWLGLFEASAGPDGYEDWCYVNGQQQSGERVPTGQVNFSTPGVGTYEIRMYANDGFTLLAKAAVTVVEAGGGASDVTVTGISQPVMLATWAGSKHVKDWIGLCLVGAPDSQVIDWKYTSTTQQAGDKVVPAGSCQFDEPPISGSYEFRFYEDDKMTSVTKSNPIEV